MYWLTVIIIVNYLITICRTVTNLNPNFRGLGLHTNVFNKPSAFYLILYDKPKKYDCIKFSNNFYLCPFFSKLHNGYLFIRCSLVSSEATL